MTAQASKKKLVCVINFGKCEWASRWVHSKIMQSVVVMANSLQLCHRSGSWCL
jgi:hypothetical protein